MPQQERRYIVTEPEPKIWPRRREYFWIALAVLLALFAHFRTAHADEGVRLEVLGGQCQVSAIGSGVWYQREYPHDLQLSSACLQIGISEILTQRHGFDLGVRLAYVDLGTARMRSEFAVLDHEQRLVPNGQDCNPVTFSGCKAYGKSVQRIQGISVGVLAERDVGHSLRVGLEGGVFLYTGSFDVSIDVHGAAAQRWDLHWQGEYLSPYVGMTLQRRHLLVFARLYTAIRAGEHNCGGCSGFTKGEAAFVGVGASF